MTDNKNDKKRKKLTVSLGSDHDAWIALSKKYGVKPSTLAALVLKDLIEKDEKDADVKTQNITELVPVTGKVVLHQHLRLREDEVRLLDQYAMIMGLTRHQALVGLVRALVVDEPQFTIVRYFSVPKNNCKKFLQIVLRYHIIKIVIRYHET